MAQTKTRKTTGKKRRTKKKSKNKKINFLGALKNDRFRFFSGVFLLFFGVLLIFSFTSFLFTWKQDQDVLGLNWINYIFNTNVTVENSAGKIGLFLSHIFVYNWFGIASYAIVWLVGVSGVKLLKIKDIRLKKTFKYTAFLIVWTSITLSFLLGESYLIVGGGFGYKISNWLTSFIGSFGAGFILLLLLFVFLTFTVDGFLPKIKIFFQNISKNKKLSTAMNAAKNATDSLSKGKRKIEKEENEDDDETDILKTKKDIELSVEKESKEENIIIDLDTNEPLQLTNKKQYELNDSGEEKVIADDLGFEVENTIKTNKPIKAEHDDGFDIVNAEPEKKEEPKLALEVEENEDIISDNVDNFPMINYDPTLDLSNFELPSVELLDLHASHGSDVSKEELLRNKNKIVDTLKNYKIEIQKIKATIGPTITLYEIIPAPGVRISKIRNLEDDIALSLAALGIRIIAPMPGRGTIGIEVPNENPETVSMRSVIMSSAFQDTKMDLPIALGKTISNESYVFDLAKMPHILVAGATGQGKSVGLNAMIASILYKKHPSEVKFVLVDPKKVELTLYERLSKHYLACLPDEEEAIVTDNQKVIYTVSSLNIEMDDRYQLLKKAQVRNIKEYNEKFVSRKLNPNNGHKYFPYIILVIDEFADLIMTAGKEIELPIARLAQLARAVGIHLIVATQRPSTNIITGTIKANFPARVAFKVASMIDSRTILDSSGANQLVGRGDMLIIQGSELVRLQCAYIDTPELDKITEYINGQQGYTTPHYLPEPEGMDEDEPGKVDLSKRDELFEESAKIVVIHQQGSTSLIQRKLSIGYNRAGRIIDQLEAAGIVGPSKGSKARDVYYVDEYSLQQLLSTLP